MRFLVLIIFCVESSRLWAASPLDFDSEIQPILNDRCSACHGADEQESGLALHSLGHLKLGGDRANLVVPGKSDESLLYQVLLQDGDIARMPLDDDPLSAEQIATVKAWIDAGAPGFQEAPTAKRTIESDHWSFQPIQRPTVPTPSNHSLVRNPIDSFVLSSLEQQGVEPSSEADRATLIRRLSLDLLGLLPTPEELDDFVSDEREDAYERLVDRLLDSPHFGERWGRHWLDAARYADSNGYTIDGARSIWPYRDWVIDAYNRNLPFDQFVIEQLAGDLLPNPTREQLIATGFHRNTLINEEGGTDKEQFRVEAVVDRVSTTGTVFLGLTVGCAQCHTHKYDPITQREFYEMFAIFNQCDEPNLELPTLAQEQQKSKLTKQLAEAKQTLKAYDTAANITDTSEQMIEKFIDWKKDHEGFWAKLVFTKVSAVGTTQFKRLSDESWLVKQPETHETYILEWNNPVENPHSIRIEALTHESIKNRGPGLTEHGNFTLNEVTLETEDGTPIKLVRAQADHSQKGGEVEHAIDGDPKSFWAINASSDNQHSDREIQLAIDPAQPIPVGTKLRLKLQQAYGNAPYLIGRFRVSVTTAPEEYLQIPLLARRVWEQAEKWDEEKFTTEIKSHLQKVDPARKELLEAIAKLETDIKSFSGKIDRTMILRARAEPRESHIHIRGDFLRKGAVVKPDVLAVMHELPPDVTEPNRLEYARWLMSPENPLTARVTVNRFWQRLFGLGIVETENDFGTQGEKPTHPELLDWLASEFIQNGWNVKQTLKLIVTSHTYRQSSHQRDDLLERDPRNRLLARQSRVRLEAEVIRDVGLDASGLLSKKMGGPGVYPPQPDGIYVLTQVKKKWDTDEGDDRHRRGLYTYLWRSSPYPFLPTFDAPSPTMACTRRVRSNTPLQALTLANDIAFVEMARALAKRILTEGPDYDAGRIRYAWKVCFSREPTEAELNRMTEFVQQQRETIDRIPPRIKPTPRRIRTREYLPAEQQAAWIMTARVLINLDEFISRE